MHATLHGHSAYERFSQLASATQPRLLPKRAAEVYGNRDGLRHAHLVVHPASGVLLWSAEHMPGLLTLPRPLFARGRVSYLVSVVPNTLELETPQPVDRTVLVDAAEPGVVAVFKPANPRADDRLPERLGWGHRQHQAQVRS